MMNSSASRSRELVCGLILATDMSRHESLLQDFGQIDVERSTETARESTKEVGHSRINLRLC